MIDRETFEEICHEERLKLWTDCDEAIVGIATKRDSYSQPLVVYNRDKLVENFMKKDGMTFDEAESGFLSILKEPTSENNPFDLRKDRE